MFHIVEHQVTYLLVSLVTYHLLVSYQSIRVRACEFRFTNVSMCAH